MRVCFLSRRFFPTISGMSVYALNLVRELAALGHEVTLVAQYRGDEEGRRVYGGGPPVDVPGVRVLGLEARGEMDGGDFERDVEELAETVEREGPFDLIHAQYGYPPGLAALEAARRLGIPSVVSIQGGDGHWVGTCCGTHRAAIRAVLLHAGAVLIGSSSFAAEVAERQDVPRARFTVVPGAVDTARFRPPGRRPEPDGHPVLLYHGRVDARKGVLELLEALVALREERPVRLVVSGVGPDAERVAARVGELGLGDAVELAGYAGYREAPGVYHRGDVFVSPTHAEGFSNTILEAMASGLPVVSTRVVGVVDCLRDGENGLLVAPDDPEALASALLRLHGDPALAADLGRAGRETVEERFDGDRLAELLAGLFREQLA
jgi:glycogen(starch) synthase